MIALLFFKQHANLLSRYKWVTHKSSIALVGDEKRIYAYEIERKGLDDTVVPAISDI